MTDTLSYSSAPPGDAISSTPLSKPDMGQLARFDTHWTTSSVAIVSAHGDIDMTNARTLTEYSLADLAHGLRRGTDERDAMFGAERRELRTFR